MFFDVRYSITYSTNLFSLVIGNRDTEFLFEFHDKFYSVKRISSQVVSEASFTNDLGADSLDTVELIMEFEKEFGISIPDDQAEKIGTVGDAVSYIEEHAK